MEDFPNGPVGQNATKTAARTLCKPGRGNATIRHLLTMVSIVSGREWKARFAMRSRIPLGESALKLAQPLVVQVTNVFLKTSDFLDSSPVVDFRLLPGNDRLWPVDESAEDLRRDCCVQPKWLTLSNGEKIQSCKLTGNYLQNIITYLLTLS